MKNLILTLLLVAASAVAQPYQFGGPYPQGLPVVSLQAPVTGSPTAGIQEAINTVQQLTNYFAGYSAGIHLQLGAGSYLCSTQIVIPNGYPLQFWLEGAGRQSTEVRFLGNYNTNFIDCATNWSRNSSPRFNYTMTDIAVTYVTNFTKALVHLAGYNSVQLKRVWFSSYNAYTNNAFSEANGTNVSGVTGLYLEPCQNADASIEDSFFWNLANGIYSGADTIYIQRNYFTDIGCYNANTLASPTYVFTNSLARVSNTPALFGIGAGVVLANGYGAYHIQNNFFVGCNATVASAGSGNFINPKLVDNYVAAGNYRIATTDSQPLESVNWHISGGPYADGLITNWQGIYAVSPYQPQKVLDSWLGLYASGSAYLAYGASNNATVFGVDQFGSLTNQGGLNLMGGRLSLAGYTSRTNLVITGAGNAEANGVYYATNGPSGATTCYTNATTGAFVVTGGSLASLDTTELFNSARTPLYGSSQSLIQLDGQRGAIPVGFGASGFFFYNDTEAGGGTGLTNTLEPQCTLVQVWQSVISNPSLTVSPTVIQVTPPMESTNWIQWGAAGVDATLRQQWHSSGTNVVIGGFKNISAAGGQWGWVDFTNTTTSAITVTWPVGTRLIGGFTTNQPLNTCTVTNGKVAQALWRLSSLLGQTVTNVQWGTQQN